MTLQYEMVSEDLKLILLQLMKIDELNSFRLVGGTNLALQMGHRSSIDIDLFAGGGAPPPKELANILERNFRTSLTINRFQQFGLSATINQVKVDLYDWKVPYHSEPVIADGLRLASSEDIFAFKCEALTGRRVEKDFVDIAEILSHQPMAEMLSVFQHRYPFISKAAVLAILLKPESFERDSTIKYASGKSWEVYVTIMKEKIIQYETQLQQQKKDDLDKRDADIQKLIEEKRKSKS